MSCVCLATSTWPEHGKNAGHSGAMPLELIAQCSPARTGGLNM
jgi:hypothetical protein